MSPPRLPCHQLKWWRRGCQCAWCVKQRGEYNQTPARKAYMAAYQAEHPRPARRRRSRKVYQREWKAQRREAATMRWRCGKVPQWAA